MSHRPGFTLSGSLKDGKLIFDRPERYQDLASWLSRTVSRVTVTIQKEVKKRSLKMNAWHWAVAVPLIAQELGYERDEYQEVHYALVSKCFGVTVDPRTGLEIPNKRSSKLSTEEFSELMAWEQRWAAKNLGIVVPDPDSEFMFKDAAA